MNTVLLVCKSCNRICGCVNPDDKTCHSCTSHDCPLLPAPSKPQGYCESCGDPAEQRFGAADYAEHTWARAANF